MAQTGWGKHGIARKTRTRTMGQLPNTHFVHGVLVQSEYQNRVSLLPFTAQEAEGRCAPARGKRPKAAANAPTETTSAAKL